MDTKIAMRRRNSSQSSENPKGKKRVRFVGRVVDQFISSLWLAQLNVTVHATASKAINTRNLSVGSHTILIVII